GIGAGGNTFITSLNPAALHAYVCAMESGMIGNIWSPTAVGSPNVLSPSAALVTQPNRSNPNIHRPATNAPCGNNADSSKPKKSRALVRRCDSASAAEVSHVVVGVPEPGAAPPSLGTAGRSRTNTEAPRILTPSQISPPAALGTTVAAGAGKSRTTARSHNRTRSVSCIQSSGLEFHFPLSLAQVGAQVGAHGGAEGRAKEAITSPPTGSALSGAANDGKVKLTRALTERNGTSAASGTGSGAGSDAGSGAGNGAAGSRREFTRSRTASERVGDFNTPLSPRATTRTRSRSPISFAASPETQRPPPLAARSKPDPAAAPPAPSAAPSSAARRFPDLYPDCGDTDGSPRDPRRKSDSDASVDDLYPSSGAVFPRFASIGDVSSAEGSDIVGDDNANRNANAKKKLHPALSRRSRSAGSQSAAALAASMGVSRGEAVSGADVGGSRTGPSVVQLAPRMGFVDWAGIGSPKTGGTAGGTSFGASSGGASVGGSGASKLRLQPLDSSKSPSSASPSPRFPVAIPSLSAASPLPAGPMPGSRNLPPAAFPYSAGAPPLSPLGRAGTAVVPRPTHRRAISAAQLSPRVPSPSARLARPPSSPSVAGKAPGAAAPVIAAAAAGGISRSASASASVPAVARSSPRARILQSATGPSSATREATAEDGGAYAESTGATANRAGKPTPMLKPVPRSMSAEPALALPVLAHPVGLEGQGAHAKQHHVGQQQQQQQQQQQLQGSSREHVGNYRRAAPSPLAVPTRRRNSMSSMPQGDAASNSARAGSAAANGGVRIGSARGQGSPGAWPARSPVGTAGGRVSPPPLAPSPPRSSPPPVAPAPGGDSCKEQQVGYSGQSLSQQQHHLKKRQQAASRRTYSVDFDYGRSKSNSSSSSSTPTTTTTSSGIASTGKSPVRASGRGGAVILTSPCPSPSRAQVVFIDGVPMPLRSALKSPSIDIGLGNTGSNLGNTRGNLGNSGGNFGNTGGRSSSVSPIFRHASPLVAKGGGGGSSGEKEGREGKEGEEGKGGRVLHPQAQNSPRRVSFSGYVEVQEYVRDSEGRGRTRGR
ncbi:unnamed protein product, partial [Closterium sp. NIES-54]